MRRFIAAISRLPWWVLLCIAGGAYFAFQHLLTLVPRPAAVTNFVTLAILATLTITKNLFKVFQYLIPIMMAGVMVGKLLRRSGPRSVYRKVSRAAGTQAALEGITWYQFEQLIGEVFRRQGFKAEETRKGADGGVDLVLTRGRDRYLVQCKRWRAAKVSVTTIRELYGVIAAEGASGGFVVTSGSFTKSAVAFASDKNIRLVGGSTLARWMK